MSATSPAVLVIREQARAKRREAQAVREQHRVLRASYQRQIKQMLDELDALAAQWDEAHQEAAILERDARRIEDDERAAGIASPARRVA